MSKSHDPEKGVQENYWDMEVTRTPLITTRTFWEVIFIDLRMILVKNWTFLEKNIQSCDHNLVVKAAR